MNEVARSADERLHCYIAEEFATHYPKAEVYRCTEADAAIADAGAQKERCAGLTAAQWRALWIKTSTQYERAHAALDEISNRAAGREPLLRSEIVELCSKGLGERPHGGCGCPNCLEDLRAQT